MFKYKLFILDNAIKHILIKIMKEPLSLLSLGFATTHKISSPIKSEDKFIEEISKKPLDTFKLNCFLVNFEAGQKRVEFIKKMTLSHGSEMDEVFRSLVEKGLKDKIYINDVEILIDDFVNEGSGFDIVTTKNKLKNINCAVSHGRTRLVEAILKIDPDSVNFCGTRNYPIHIAASNRQTHTLMALIQCPQLKLYSRTTRKGQEGKTVFDVANGDGKKSKNIIAILEKEHQRRLELGDPDAIAYENSKSKDQPLSLLGEGSAPAKFSRPIGIDEFLRPSGKSRARALPDQLAPNEVSESRMALALPDQLAPNEVGESRMALTISNPLQDNNPDFVQPSASGVISQAIVNEEFVLSDITHLPLFVPGLRIDSSFAIVNSIHSSGLQIAHSFTSPDDSASAFRVLKKRRSEDSQQKVVADPSCVALKSQEKGGRGGV